MIVFFSVFQTYEKGGRLTLPPSQSASARGELLLIHLLLILRIIPVDHALISLR